jgi:D-3-phosphoglycerate dehydrogenase
MNNKINLIIDFDSTFIKLETIEILADFSLSNKSNKVQILNQIKDITNKAMLGDIPFSEALDKRIQLIKPKVDHINKTIEFLKSYISNSFLENKNFLKSYNENCFIVSGGFKEIIVPIVKEFKISEKHIFANTFIYNNNNICLDKSNPLSRNNGKNIIAKNISGNNIIIGDGYTDYEVKKHGNAKKFIQFTENINRKSLNNKADFICNDFKEIISYINNDI